MWKVTFVIAKEARKSTPTTFAQSHNGNRKSSWTLQVKGPTINRDCNLKKCFSECVCRLEVTALVGGIN